VVRPAIKKQVVTDLTLKHRISERRACKLVGLSRTGYRYHHKQRNDIELRDRLKDLARDYSSYGYLFLHSMLKAEGLVVNKKRTYRVYTEEGLQVRTKKRKKLQRPRMPMSSKRVFIPLVNRQS
jgi:putative transposase